MTANQKNAKEIEKLKAQVSALQKKLNAQDTRIDAHERLERNVYFPNLLLQVIASVCTAKFINNITDNKNIDQNFSLLIIMCVSLFFCFGLTTYKYHPLKKIVPTWRDVATEALKCTDFYLTSLAATILVEIISKDYETLSACFHAYSPVLIIYIVVICFGLRIYVIDDEYIKKYPKEKAEKKTQRTMIVYAIILASIMFLVGKFIIPHTIFINDYIQ